MRMPTTSTSIGTLKESPPRISAPTTPPTTATCTAIDRTKADPQRRSILLSRVAQNAAIRRLPRDGDR
jgi:hypothetical protein